MAVGQVSEHTFLVLHSTFDSNYIIISNSGKVLLMLHVSTFNIQIYNTLS